MRILVILVLLTLALPRAFAERLEYAGTYVASTKYQLRITLERLSSSESFTVTGVLEGEGQNYKVSGRLISKTRKLRGYIIGTGKNGEAIERVANGSLSEDLRFLTVQCRVSTPGGVSVDALFSCRRQDQAEDSETVSAYVLDKSFSTNPSDTLIVSPHEGTARIRYGSNQGWNKTGLAKFSSIPRVIALGSKWDFWLDASEIPKDVKVSLRIQAHFVDVSADSPYVTFDTTAGDRIFRRPLTWNMSADNGSVSIQLSLDQYHIVSYFYKLKKVNRSELSSLAGQSGGTAPVMGQPPVPSRPASEPIGTPGSGVSAYQVTDVQGDISIQAGIGGTSDFQRLLPGSLVPAGSTVQVGAGSHATIPLPNGGQIKLQPVSSVYFEELPPVNGVRRVAVRVITGEVLYQHSGRSVPVKTDLIFRVGQATIKPTGTKFKLKYAQTTELMSLTLEEGTIEFNPGHELPSMKLDAPTVVTVTVGKA